MRGLVRLLSVVLGLLLAAQPVVAASAAPAGQGAPSSPSDPSRSPSGAAPQASGAKKPAQKKTSRPPKVLSSPGSGETRAERTARLRRECKGMPNAGACTGMTD